MAVSHLVRASSSAEISTHNAVNLPGVHWLLSSRRAATSFLSKRTPQRIWCGAVDDSRCVVIWWLRERPDVALEVISRSGGSSDVRRRAAS